ncbi:amino acid ABC transporter permease [Helicobacter sp. MIT 99-5507]|uniref:amino acid ABC transporter permease n=1 Tax=Helicobacter sp. MIT 99-5507 TaxID=152489 RepID=UPI000E1F146E|nr:amino acid ABC transporter permease [Helicobacter sp. MIT 99-5507]RDU58272.1 amino acid ABC transporter permease [Helicobacter sp. MIT 99-5507]
MFEILNDGANLSRILTGLGITIKIAFISIFFSMIFGIIFGVLMVSKNIILSLFFRFYLEFIRIMPPIVLLFLVFFGLPQISSISLDSTTSAIIVFVLWGSIEMADLVRGAILSLPKHQVESSLALGMSPLMISRYIILPQVFIRLLPLAINLSSRIIKTTSIAPLIGVVEVLKTGQQIIEYSILKIPDAPFWIYGLIFILYFIICYPLSWLSSYLEKKYQY